MYLAATIPADPAPIMATREHGKTCRLLQGILVGTRNRNLRLQLAPRLCVVRSPTVRIQDADQATGMGENFIAVTRLIIVSFRKR
jgi:hypothetical protein